VRLDGNLNSNLNNRRKQFMCERQIKPSNLGISVG
jgi:hypothetical protein